MWGFVGLGVLVGLGLGVAGGFFLGVWGAGKGIGLLTSAVAAVSRSVAFPGSDQVPLQVKSISEDLFADLSEDTERVPAWMAEEDE